MKINEYMVISVVFVFFFVLVSIQYTLNQILKTLREIRNRQDRHLELDRRKRYDNNVE